MANLSKSVSGKNKSDKYLVIKKKKKKPAGTKYQVLDAILSVKTLIEQNTSGMSAAKGEVEALKAQVAELKRANEELANKLMSTPKQEPVLDDDLEQYFISEKLENVLVSNPDRPNRDEVNDLLFGTESTPGLLSVNDQFFDERDIRFMFNLIFWNNPTFSQLNKLRIIRENVTECQFNTTF
jgi:hypothetical protein